MLIAITGSQGSGKSTILSELSSSGHNVIERKTSRSILSEWNVTLAEVNNDLELTQKFQYEITNRKRDDEASAMYNDELWFTERTHMDLFTYALISLGKDNQYSNWLNEYYRICCAYSADYKDVFFVPNGQFKVSEDGVRGHNQHYSNMVNNTMLSISKDVFNNLHTIKEVSIQSRLRCILSITNKY